MTIYRTPSVSKYAPNFSFIEKLFLSSKYHRALGHCILILQPLARLLAIGIIILLSGTVVIGLIFALGYLLASLSNFLSQYISSQIADSLIAGGIFLFAFIIYIIPIIKKSIIKNNSYMSQRILYKLNKDNV